MLSRKSRVKFEFFDFNSFQCLIENLSKIFGKKSRVRIGKIMKKEKRVCVFYPAPSQGSEPSILK